GPNSFTSNSSSASVSSVVAGTHAGAYNLSVTKNGCTSTASSTVTINANPIAAITGTNILCEGANLSLTATDAGTGAAYTWSGPNSFTSNTSSASVSSVTATHAGTYNLSVTKNGCTSTASSTVTINANPVASITGTNVLCVGANLSLTAADAGTGAVYSWSGPNSFTSNTSSASVSNITAATNAGTYNLSVTKNGCTSTASSTVTINANPLAAITGTNVLCEGANLSLTATDAGTGAAYSWSGPNSFTSNTSSASVSSVAATTHAGTYNLSVIKNGCTSTASSTVTINANPLAAITGTNVLCEGANLSLTAADAGTGAAYSWGGPNSFTSNTLSASVSNVVAGTHAGTYNLSVRKNGCTSTASSTVTINANPIAAIIGTNVLCEGANLSLTAADAGTGAAYTWSGPNSFTSNTSSAFVSNILAATNAGTYNLSVTKNGCTSTASSTVTINANPIAAIIGTNVLCEGANLSLTATDAGTGATYSWTKPGNTNSNSSSVLINNVSAANAGTYNLVVYKDGCASRTSSTVTINQNPLVNITGSNVLCEGTELKLTGNAISGASYNWSGPNNLSSSNTQVSIPKTTSRDGGNYDFSITSNGCTSKTSVLVNIKPNPIAAITGSNILCEGSNVDLSAQNNTGATYSWTGPNNFISSSANVSIVHAASINSGMYNLTVTKDGCSSDTFSTISINANPVAAISGKNILCEGTSLDLTAQDAGAGTTYNWSGPNSYTSPGKNLQISNIVSASAGNYILTVTKDGCTSQISQNVVINQNPSINVFGKNIVCEGSDLVFIANTAGSDAVYNWSGPHNFNSNQSAIQLKNITTDQSGPYHLQVSKDGCTADTVINAIVNNLPSAKIQGTTELCEATALSLSVVNPNAAVNYQWLLPTGKNVTAASLKIDSIPAELNGVYTLTAEQKGCIAKTETAVNVKSLPFARVAGKTVVCEGEGIHLSAINAGTDANYKWKTSSGQEFVGNDLMIYSASLENAGRYELVVSRNGCSAKKDTIVVVKALPKPIISGKNSLCEGSPLNLLAVDAGTDASYTWQTPSGLIISGNTLHADSATAASNGQYYLTIIKDGCTTKESIGVAVNKKPQVGMSAPSMVCQFSAPFTVAGFENNNQQGSGIFQGIGITSTGTFNPSTVGDFNIRYEFTAAGGCSATTSALIKVVPGVKANAGADKEIMVGQEVQLNATVSGQYSSILWSSLPVSAAQQLNPVVKPVQDQTYILTVKNEFGCLASDQVLVKVISLKIPNAFSPNGDGVHDQWVIEGIQNFNQATVEVYNRYGALVYKGNGQPWDGTAQGKIVSGGTYYYLIRLNNDLHREPFTGWVQILK
ncbi:MAG: hypothetical protein JWN76_1454, partial [Chitinophagaceae bacterium]|nr:hypothetical protein [Chitinophagaceae bacterium]